MSEARGRAGPLRRGLAVLLVVRVLNMYKPRGMTRYGWRQQQEERLAEQAPGPGSAMSPTP